MRDEVRKIIEKVCNDGNKEWFVRCCNSKISFLDELIEKISQLVDSVEIYPSLNEPKEEIHISVNTKTIEIITIQYESILTICKIGKFFYLQHEFSLNNPDEDRIDPDFDGFRDEAYNKKQFIMDDIIVRYLNEKGYTRLSYLETQEEYREPVFLKEYGKEEYLTVNNLLFMDFLGLNR